LRRKGALSAGSAPEEGTLTMNESSAPRIRTNGVDRADTQSNFRLPLHLFEVEGKQHAFDPESGKFFRIDRVAATILALLPTVPVKEITARLESTHPPETVRSVLSEIEELVGWQLLFAESARPGKKPEPAAVDPHLVSVTLNVVSSCNLDCIYCWNKGGTYGRVKKEKRMNAATAQAAVDLMVKHSSGIEELLVDFYGGEPLLNFEALRSTMDYCKELEGTADKRFTYKVTTNGVGLTKDMVEYFNTIGISLGISIDGAKKVHNRNRPFPDGRGSYQTILNNLELLSGTNNIHVSARATLLPPDLDMVKATKSLFKLGFYDTEVEFASEPCESFNPDGYYNYTNGDTERMKKEYLKFAKFYVKYTLYKEEAIDVGISNNLTRVLHQTHRFAPCGAGNSFLCVTEEGDLYPCMGFIGMADFKLGTVFEGFDLERLKTFRHQMRSVIFEAEECRDCWARNICAGNCPANNQQHNKKIFEPYERGCDWLKFQLEVAMWAASEIKSKKPSRLEGYEPV
jgi:uncharacterized protein